jgi:cytochrome c553
MAATERRSVLRRAAASLAVAALALVCALFLFALSGLYDIAASREHLAPIRQVLEIAKRRSVAVYSAFVEVPRLDDSGLVKLGAGHFAMGCAPCHGAPGAAVGPIAKRMQPAPPDLSQIAPTWSSQELFWIVRNGLKYTGMPAWPAARDDEVWTVVAFLRVLPALDAGDYAAMTGGTRSDLTQLDSHDASVRNCARCHGDASATPVSLLVPSLNGQSAAYLELALTNYADGRRPSGIMQPIAASVEAADRSRLAAFYAALTPSVRTATTATDARIEQGHRIATAGVPGRRIPACLTCHGDSGRATYPRLAGQSGAYLASQLRLLQTDARAHTPQGAIMTPIARLLSPEEIEAVAAYFDSQRTVASDTGHDPQRTP